VQRGAAGPRGRPPFFLRRTAGAGGKTRLLAWPQFEESLGANRRRDRRHGKPGGLLHLAAAPFSGARSLAGHAASLGGGGRWEAPDSLGVCCSAGATAGMASLAACSTWPLHLSVERAVLRATPPVLAAEGVGKPRTAWVCVALPARPPAWEAWRLAPRQRPVWQAVRGRTRRSAPTGDTVAVKRGRWVKGAKAGTNAGRRHESPPHKNSLPHKEGLDHNSSRSKVWSPAPQQRLLHKKDLLHKTACPTKESRPQTRMSADNSRQPQAWRPAPQENSSPTKAAWTPTELGPRPPAVHAILD